MAQIQFSIIYRCVFIFVYVCLCLYHLYLPNLCVRVCVCVHVYYSSYWYGHLSSISQINESGQHTTNLKTIYRHTH